MNERLGQLQELLKESPQDPFLHYAVTMEYVKLDNRLDALAGFENMISNFPDYVGTYYHFGKFLEKEEQLNRALEIYQQGMEIAKSKRNMHALNELRGAYNLALGEDEEDEF
ncbi:tetratricopeptide repeat protein [Sphingobacterium sp. lm-10]|uniref:tetratricopeptide repeat protein n=1 Tax=Sphingobacterium sp. lm-10 TaxID=2944904 RepID=UPI0020204C5F|nr:tetratricopeptide repeat protein [Sphingobacterium sp. lm-10]MCL7989286.1 tetratricopeptide repeat protein [Sphingobacterium sp. lm-10]